MERSFNITGSCFSDEHYMVDISDRLAAIKKLVDSRKYFAINRGRQYGKTTTLAALETYLDSDYTVVSLDFQLMSAEDFVDEQAFVSAFAKVLMINSRYASYSMSDTVIGQLNDISESDSKCTLSSLFICLSAWCKEAEKPIVLMIDEVDQASNNQVFLDFLAQLRGYYLHRKTNPTFWSVILAGVHDVRNLRQKIRLDTEHKHNSPWNIAVEFDVDMSFSPKDIAGMLEDYENDHHTGMNVTEMAQMIYDETSGYPVIVSMFCKLMDEKIPGTDGFPTKSDAWTRDGFIQAKKIILNTNAPLFESLMNKIEDSPELKSSLEKVLEEGRKVAYNPDDEAIKQAIMYGFVKVVDSNVVMANRIFETRFYNALLTTSAMQNHAMYRAGENEKPEFIKNGRLDMELVLRKFVEHYTFVYGDRSEQFLESDGRKLFMLYLKPIINGTGTFYIEPQTRDNKRMDLVVDYLGQQFVIEMKIWHGEEYHKRGEQQLLGYLDYFRLQKGYMLSFNFNQKKQPGVHKVMIGDRMIFEAVV